MKNLTRLSHNFTPLTAESLASYVGGKGGFGININIDISWHALRDTLKGFGDAVTGHPRHY